MDDDDAPARLCCCWSNITSTRLLAIIYWLLWVVNLPVLVAYNVIVVVIVPFSIVWFVGLVCLTIGAFWRKSELLLVYLIVGSIVLIIYVGISALVLFFMGVVTSASEAADAKEFTWGAAVFLSLALIFQFWGLLMVSGARHEIERDRTRSAYVFKELTHVSRVIA